MDTILLVDDERMFLRSLRIGLRSKGYRTIEAFGGPEALNRLDDPNTRIDMVITDYLMPHMDGITLLKKIRKKSKSIPVIMMTAFDEKALAIEAHSNQCDSFIGKPFTLNELIAVIEEVKHRKSPSSNDL